MTWVAHPDDLTWLVVLAGFAMAFMAWGIGANDVANAFGPAFGAKSLTVNQACIIAAVCEGTGAVLMGSHVSDTIRKGMMSIELYAGDDGRVLVLIGMTSVLIAAALWLLCASKLGLPVSTTHSAVGGVIAFAITSKGYNSVKWAKIGMIIASWFISPVLSGVVAFVMFWVIKRLILQAPDSLQRAKLLAPGFVFLISFVVALFTIYKGGKGLGLNKTSVELAVGLSMAIGGVLGAISVPFVTWWARQIQEKKEKSKESPAEDSAAVDVAPETEPKDVESAKEPKTADEDVAVDVDVYLAVDKDQKTPAVDETDTEQLFTGFVVIIAGFFSVAHGANDVANSVGPFAAVLSASQGELAKKSEVPTWVFIVAAIWIVIGLVTYGVHVMETVGNKITKVTPSKAFVINFAATIVVLFATRAGIPVSTTHASVGAVVGVGMAEGVREVDWKVMSKVFLSWVLTLPIVGVTAAGVFAVLLPTVVEVPFS